MRSLIVLATIFTAATAQADAGWKDKAIEAVSTYNRIRDARWSEANSLWLFAYEAEVDWENVTEQMICWQMRSAGKPDDEAILVAWFSYADLLQGKMERMAQAWCD